MGNLIFSSMYPTLGIQTPSEKVPASNEPLNVKGSHLGRPNGQKDEKFSMKPVAKAMRVAKWLKRKAFVSLQLVIILVFSGFKVF